MHTNIQCQQCAKSCKSLEVPIILKLINKEPTSSVSAITISMKRLFRYLIQTENVLVPEEKNALHKLGLTVSRRRIGRVMKQNNLVSTYTIASYRPYPSK